MTYLQCSLQIAIVFLAITIHPSDAKRDFTIEILDANITILDWVLIKSCHGNIYGQKAVYVDFTLNTNITQFDLKVRFVLMKKDNRPITLFDLQLNGCRSMEGAQKSKLLQIIYREIFRVTNIPKKCPLLANTLYSFNNYTMNDDDFPFLTPALEFRMDADFIVGRKIKATSFLKGRVRKL